jgi:serine/threonine-protein kinase
MLFDLEEYAARARMMASPIRFGEWLLENFGRELVSTRRARTLVLEALSRGPAAVIEPIREANDDDVTPTSFPVTSHVDAESKRQSLTPTAPPSTYMPKKWTKAPLSAPASEARPGRSGAPLFVYAIAIVALALAVLWFVSSS